MNVLMISPDAPPYLGGVSRLVGLLKEGLRQQGHSVDVLCPQIKIRELKFSTIPLHRYGDKYDLIHLHGPTPLLSDLTLITNAKSTIVYTHHAEVSWVSEGLSAVYRSLHRRLAEKNARAIVVHSNDYRHLFNGFNIFLIRLPSPLNPPWKKISLGQKSDSFTVLYVGQFRSYKGLDMLVRASAILRRVRFVFVGEGYMKLKLKEMARGLENVNFVDAASDEEVRRLYSMAHVVCLPSVNTTEAYGLVLLEGALHGCVPLASNLIGVAENVSLLKGFVFERKSFSSLVKKIEILANSRRLWSEAAVQSQEAAYTYATTYSQEWFVKRHVELYRKLCENG